MEAKLLNDYFHRLAGVLDVNNLSAHFVTARILTINDDEEISDLPSSQDKAKVVLRKITKSLGAHTKDFYVMLDVMTKYGNSANAALASEIKSQLLPLQGGMLLSIIVCVKCS